jgi:hypothetical protein
MKLTKQQWYLVAAGAAFVVIAIIAAVVLLSRGNGKVAGDESTETAEATWTIETTPSEEPTPTKPGETPPAEEPPAPTQPSYVRYAYVRAVGGVPGNYTVDLDFFEIYTEDAARDYASTHGLTVPSNGILYVNESPAVETVPLKSDVQIIYKTGGVESLQQKSATPEQLKLWAAGDTESMPGSMTDMWKVTVEQGIAWKLDMVVVAD